MGTTADIARAIHEKHSNGGKVPTYSKEFVGDVLSELRASGSLVPAGGMALTAEQVEDVRTMLWSPGVTALAAFRRLRALFPATEPAEPLRFSVLEGLCGYCLMGRVFCDAIGGCVESRAAKARRAEPAAEETKAVASDWCILCRRSGHNHTAHKPQAPSPVVPTSTETGPWETVDAIPESVTRIKDCEGDVWHRCTAGWEHGGLHGPEGYAPFVAVEEG